MDQAGSFYMTLPSNASMQYYPENKPQNFTVNLPHPIELDGKWEVALMEIQYPKNWFNIRTNQLVRVAYEVKTAEDDNAAAARRRHMQSRDGVKEDLSLIPGVAWTMKKGYYASIEDLCTHINQNLAVYVRAAGDSSRKPPVLSYDTASQRVSIDVEGMNAHNVRMTFDEELVAVLGLDSAHEYYHIPLKGTRQASLSAHQPALYIYADFLEHQIVGDIRAPLLRAVPIRGRDQEITSVAFERPYYHEVAKGYISSMEIKICGDDGVLIPFAAGKVILVLHFRKRGIF